MKVIDCPQYSAEWWSARRGIPTSSGASRIITTKKADYAAAAQRYIAELIAADLGWQAKEFVNEDTERGHYFEDEARRWISLQLRQKVRQVGFCLSDCGRYGASPDGLLDDGTPLEIKAPDTHTFIGWAMDTDTDGNPVLPDDHKAQCHMHMLVTGAQRCLFCAYPAGNGSEYLDRILLWVERDEFTEALAKHLDRFCAELEAWRRKLTGEEYENLWP